MRPEVVSPPPVGHLDGLVQRLQRRFRDANPGRPAERAALRGDLDALVAELDDAGRRQASDAAKRVELLAEVWDCLAAEGADDSAAEVADFCARALGKLAATSPAEEVRGALSWVVEESDDRWGEYLNLLDGSSPPARDLASDEMPIEEPAPLEDEPSAIDPANLLRMLMGTADATPPAPHVRPPAPAPAPAPAPSRAPAPAPAPSRAPAPPPSFFAPPIEDLEPPPAAPKADELDDFPALPTRIDLGPELREAFLAEATDLFERIETLVLGLGSGGDQSEALHELGRCYHTLKGAAGSVGLIELASMVHELEERLDGAKVASDELIDLFHRGLRYLEGILDVLRGAKPTPPPPPAPAPRLSATKAAPENTPAPAPRAEEPAAEAPQAAEGPLRVPSAKVDDLMDLVSELITRRGLWMAQAEAMKEFTAHARASRNQLMASVEKFHDLGLSREPGDVSRGALKLEPSADLPWLIRRLAEQAEDLAVLTDSAQAASFALADHRDAFDRLTIQLWDALQAIRITPVRGLFQRLARVAHDAARVEGRQVEVVMSGEDNGLDRAVQDKAFEPMLHMVRNAVGHGIEAPADRAKAGKRTVGRVTLSARREGNTLALAVADDGRGLDYKAIEAKGRRLGLLGPDETPSIDRLNGLVFQPGFSTRDSANAISGRGVGMDVVSQEVSRLHGTIDMVSQTGSGTQLTVRLPVRLALERVMVVRIDGQAFALPVSLVELAQQSEAGAMGGSGPDAWVQVRGRRVPLIDGREALGFATSSPASNPKLLLIRAAEDDSVALLVDAIEGTKELVLKPLGTLLAGHPVVSGTGFSTTGEVILALNPSGMSRWFRQGGRTMDSAPKSNGRTAPVLVVDDSISVRKVVTKHLRGLGLEVEEVSNGMEALSKLRGQSFSMILTDLEMPHLDGFELLAELGRTRLLETVPVVVASTKCDPETRRRILELGARAFVPKPVEPDELARVVRPLIGAAAVPSSPGPRVSQPRD